MKDFMIRFEHGQEDRISKEYGPFPFVQLTYGELRTGPEGDPFAYYLEGAWFLIDNEDKDPYTDVIIYPV